MADDTRARILRAAQDAFASDGYQATSIQKVAARVGLSKAAVVAHFATKEDLLSALATPMLDALSAAVAGAASATRDVRKATLTGLLDVFLAHRQLLRANLRDGSLLAALPFERYRDALLRAGAQVAGREPDLRERVRAAQAIAAVTDPVLQCADAETDALRSNVLSGMHKLLGGPLAAAKDRPRRGRPRALSVAQVERARKLYAGGTPPADIAEKLGVSRATMYRHLR